MPHTKIKKYPPSFTIADLENRPHPPNRPGRIYSPIISPEEAFLSVKPYTDYMAAHQPKKAPGTDTIATLVQALGAIAAINAVYKQITGHGIGGVAGGKGGAAGGGGLLSDLFGGLKGIAHATGLDSYLGNIFGTSPNDAGPLFGGSQRLQVPQGEGMSGRNGIESIEDILGPISGDGRARGGNTTSGASGSSFGSSSGDADQNQDLEQELENVDQVTQGGFGTGPSAIPGIGEEAPIAEPNMSYLPENYTPDFEPTSIDASDSVDGFVI